MDEDSLSLELKKHDVNKSNIRPTTTGDIIESKPLQKNRLGDPSKNRVYGTLAPTTLENNAGAPESIRPRAPRSKLLSLKGSGAASVPRTKKSLRNPKSKDLSELFENLHRFDQTNLGRSLDISKQNHEDEIHYVNIASKTNQSRISSSEEIPLFEQVHRPRPGDTNGPFSIPQLPSGKVLTLNILSTWGDPHYVGLMGIDIFDSSGHLVKLSCPERQIWADPPDINVLPNCSNDPRTVDNLLDGINNTCDDLHAWLAPFTSGSNHFVWIEFDELTTISMIRIWNYNKSRIHSHRGARYVEILLDMKYIFKGEIKQAPGVKSILNYEDNCEFILFTTNVNILALIERYDPAAEEYNSALKELQESKRQSSTVHRPVLFDMSKKADAVSVDLVSAPSFPSASFVSGGDRPATQAGVLRSRKALKSPLNTTSSTTGSSNTRHDLRRLNSMSNPSSSSSSLSSNMSSINWSNMTFLDDQSDVNSSESTLAGQRSKSSRTNGSVSNEIENFFEENKLDDKLFNSIASDIDDGDVDNVEHEETDHFLEEDDGMLGNSASDFMNRSTEDLLMDCSISGVDFPCISSLGSTASSSSSRQRPSTAALAREQPAVSGQVLELVLLNTWGDSEWIGLCGIVGSNPWMEDFILPCPTLWYGDMIVQIKKDDTFDFSLEKWSQVPREQMTSSVESLVDGMADDPMHSMWAMRYPRDACVVIRFDFGSATRFKGLRMWNYNGSGEGTLIGVQHVPIFLDGKFVSSVLVRKAPGVFHIDFAQYLPLGLSSKTPRNKIVELLESKRGKSHSIRLNRDELKNSGVDDFSLSIPPKRSLTSKRQYAVDSFQDYSATTTTTHSSSRPSVSRFRLCTVPQQYETPIHPVGCMIKIVVNSTHGDRFYVGLNGIELYDENGEMIQIEEGQLQAFPYRDINDLEEIRKQGTDCRCLANLLSPINNTFVDSYIWLAPFTGPNSAESQAMPLSILILFDQAISLSYIKIWNYAKTKERGAKSIEVFFDDVLLYSGDLLPSPRKEDLQYDTNYESVPWLIDGRLDLSQAILFTDRQDIIDRESSRIPLAVDDIEFIDEGQNMNIRNSKTSVSHVRRPMTTASGR